MIPKQGKKKKMLGSYRQRRRETTKNHSKQTKGIQQRVFYRGPSNEIGRGRNDKHGKQEDNVIHVAFLFSMLHIQQDIVRIYFYILHQSVHTQVILDALWTS